jgi:hypothetical protein
VHDPADHTPVINAMSPAPVINAMSPAPATRHQRLDPLPIRIGKPIELLLHQGFLDSEALNHNSARVGILIEYGP